MVWFPKLPGWRHLLAAAGGSNGARRGLGKSLRRRRITLERLEDRRLLAIYDSNDVPKPLVDNGTVTSVLNVSDSFRIDDVNVRLNISHTWDWDLSVYLVSPDNTKVELFSQVGGAGDNFTNTVLDDEAPTSIVSGNPPFTGTFRPEGRLASFDGKNVLGTWTLEVTDILWGFGGTLHSWSLEVALRETPLFSDDFPSTTFDNALWTSVIGATVDGTGTGERSAPYSARLNGQPNGGDRLESRAIDLSAVRQATLSYYYQKKGGGESPDTGDDLITEYWNGAGWVEIQRHPGSQPDMTSYSLVSIPLPATAFHNGFRFRFRSIGTADPNIAFDDWFVDDVRVSAADGSPGFDGGDAPLPYPTLWANDGARHRLVNHFYLGGGVDAESDGRPGDGATLDDTTGTPDDEDGVLFLTPLELGTEAALLVTASAPGKLDAWIDWNDDGDWSDPGERVFANQFLGGGANQLTIAVPVDATLTSQTYARFRLSSTGVASFTGAAADGEVEDYAVAIQLAPPVLLAEPSVTPGTSNLVRWSAVPGANQYYAECDDRADFASPNMNSGWIADTQYTFSGLTSGVTYYYRVKARDVTSGADGAWTQTTLTDFTADTHTNTSATNMPGSVVLAGGRGGEIAGRLSNPSFENGSVGSTPLGWTSSVVGNLREYESDAPYFGMPAGGSRFEQMYTLNSFAVSAGDYSAISQAIDLTGLSVLEFDASLDAPGGWLNKVKAEVLIDGAPRWSKTAAGRYSNELIDVSAYSGVHTVQLRMEVVEGGTYASQWVLFDDLRTYGSSSYESSGDVVSTVIRPSLLGRWGSLTYNATTPAGTALAVDVLPETGSTALAGYSGGADLSGITETAIRLRGKLETNNPAATPALGDWRVTWRASDSYAESAWSGMAWSAQQVGDMDFGDAPALYPTVLADNGAVHTIRVGLYLGAGVDAENDGQPDDGAMLDDISGLLDDEDGVRLLTPLELGKNAPVEVTASAAGKLDAWIDWNDDGDWSDAGERVLTGLALGPGVNPLTLAVPMTATLTSQTYARFRFSSAGVASFDGAAADGEVEDYAVSINLTSPVLEAEPSTTPGTTNTVRWSAVPGADQYLAQCDDQADFSSPTESPWIPGTEYTLTGLTPGLTYYYRVRARGPSSAWTQTTEVDFSGDVLTSTSSTTRPGDVVLVGTGAEIAGRIANPSFESAGAWNYLETNPGFAYRFPAQPVTHYPGDWVTDGASTLYTYNPGSASFVQGDHLKLTQFVDLTGVSTIEFDVKLDTAGVPGGVFAILLRVDGVEKWRQTAFGEYLNQRIDVSGLAGVHELEIRQEALQVYSGGQSVWSWWDDLRTYGSPGFISSGEVISTAITRDAADTWGSLRFQATTPGPTALVVDVLPATGSAPIPGCANLASGTDLSRIAETEIRLRATLSTLDRSVTPYLHEWTVTRFGSGSQTESAWSDAQWSIQPGVDLDFGDAPAPYPTLLAGDGARHLVVPGFYLGNGVDWESDGQPSADAELDDRTGAPDDEDGVTFSLLVPGQTATASVAASAAGKLDAWIDFDRDGRWSEAYDRVFASVPVVAGFNTLAFNVPATASAAGYSFARFRFTSAGVASFDGEVADGEVEDYRIVIQPPVFQGTTGSDTFTFTTNGTTHTVTVNGASRTLDASIVSLVRFDGQGGDDQATLTNNGATNDTLSANQAGVVLSDTAGTAYRVTVTGVKLVTVNAGAGTDTANVYDGPANDWFILHPTSADIRLDTSGPSGYVSRLLPNHFEAINGIATAWGTGGTDTATIYGTAGNDVFAGTKSQSRLTPAAGNPAVFNNTVQLFDTVHAYAMGGYDTAGIDGAAGQDNLSLRAPTGAAVSRADMTYYSSGLPTPITTSLQDFDVVAATSADTGIDFAYFYDSSGPDTYVARAGAAGTANRQARLYDSDGPGVGFDYDLTANGFGYVYVNAGTVTGGNDVATLTGSAAGTDRYTATTSGSALKYANNDLQSLNVFEQITVNGNGGTDYAVLYDTAGNDQYDVTPTQARLRALGGGYDHTLNDFTWAYAYGTTPGGYDTANFTDGVGNDRMTIGAGAVNDSYMTYTAGQVGWGRGFERVEATATPGVAVDQVWLYDTSADDVYTAMNGNNEATMMPQSGTAYSRRAAGFDKYYGYSIYGGTDEAHLYDSAGNDTLQAGRRVPTPQSPTDVSLKYLSGAQAGMELWAYVFEKVTAHATLASGDVDSALFYDDPNSSETFTADQNQARFRRNTAGWDINALGFDSMSAYGSPTPSNPSITDIAEITDSAMNDVIWTYGAFRQAFMYYGGSATNRVLAETFDSVLMKVTTGGIDSIRMDDSLNNDTFTSDDPGTPGVDIDTAIMYDDLATYFYKIQGLSGGQDPGVGDSVLIRKLNAGTDRDLHAATIDYWFQKVGTWG